MDNCHVSHYFWGDGVFNVHTVEDKNIVGCFQNQLGTTISKAERLIRGVPSSHEVVGVSSDICVCEHIQFL